MFSKRVFLLIGMLFMLIFIAHVMTVGKTVYGDGVYYYSWLHSTIIDGDVSFDNEYATLGGSQRSTPTEKAGNIYSIGPAIVWLPSYIWIHHLIHGDGYGLPYQLTVGFIGLAAAYVGLVLLYQLLTMYFSEKHSLLTITALALGTNLLYYGSVDTVNSHAVSFLAAVVFTSLILNKNATHWFVIGVSLGCVILMRTQDAILGLLVFHRLKPKDMISIAAGIAAPLVLQSLAWKMLYGSYFVSPYLYLPDYSFDFLNPKLLHVLFSPNNGLVLWTPIAGLGIIGLLLASINTRSRLSALMLTTFALQLYLVASWSTWWQGASYSGRMFVSTLPILAFGIAYIITSASVSTKTTLQIIILATILNASTILYFLSIT